MRSVPGAFVVGIEENGLAVARALGRAGIAVTALTNRADYPGCRTRFADVVVIPGLQDRLVDILLELARRELTPPVLFLTSDRDVATVNRARELLERHLVLAFPGPALVDQLMSKRGFFDLARTLNAPLPATFCFDSHEELVRILPEIPFPCILKPQDKSPIYMANAAKAYKAETAEGLLARYDEVCGFEHRMVAQEFIPGGDGSVFFCLQYYSATGRVLASFEGRKIRQWVPECGGTASAEPVIEPELARLTEHFFAAVGFRGLCSMEYKRDARTGRFLMIEPTICRTDFQSDIAVANGINLPLLAFCDLAGRPLPVLQRSRRPVKWVHLMYDRMAADYYISLGQMSRRDWLNSLKGPKVFPVFSWKDPMPGLAYFISKVKARARSSIHWNASRSSHPSETAPPR